MIVNYDGSEYVLDLDDMDVKQARTIKVATGLTVSDVQKGMMEIDPDALTALYWYMMVSNDQKCDIRRVNFKVAKFANAIYDALVNTLSDEEREDLENATGVTLNKDEESPKE